MQVSTVSLDELFNDCCTFMSFISISRLLQEFNAEALGPADATDIRLVRQEKQRLQDQYQQEIDAFIEHLK